MYSHVISAVLKTETSQMLQAMQAHTAGSYGRNDIQESHLSNGLFNQSFIFYLNKMYRTVDQHNNILETWDTFEEVSPRISYHEIQRVEPIAYAICERHSSIHEFNPLPF